MKFRRKKEVNKVPDWLKKPEPKPKVKGTVRPGSGKPGSGKPQPFATGKNFVDLANKKTGTGKGIPELTPVQKARHKKLADIANRGGK